MPTPYHPLTATGFPPDDATMIWPWPHNWATAFVRRPEWKTAISMSATGVEQRQALREYPRESITIENLLTDGDAATATSLLREWKGKPWLAPDWSEMTVITEPAGSILSLARQSIPAGLALLGDEVVTLTSPDGTLDTAPPTAWPAGTPIVPLVAASLDGDQTVTQVTGGVLRCSVNFLLDSAVPLDPGVLSRRLWPTDATEGGSGVGSTSGVYGGALTATDAGGTLTVTRPGQIYIVGAHTLEFWAKINPADITGFHWLIHAVDGTPGTASNPQVDAHNGYFWVTWAGEAAFAPPPNQWFHFAISRAADMTYRAFVNGVQITQGVDSYGDRTVMSPVTLFNGGVSGRLVFPGALDDVRMTHACRYTADFTPAPCVIGEGDPYWSDVAFLLTGDSSRWGNGPTSDPRAMVLPMSHNWAEGSDLTVARPVDELDPGTGLRHTRPVHDGSILSWSQREILEDADDLMAFRAFLQVHRGSALSFFAGPPGATVEVDFIGSGQVRTAQARFLRGRPPALIAVLLDSGWKYYAVGEGVTTPNTVRITNGTASHPAETILAARAIYRARLLGDAVEINYHTPGVAEVSLPLVAVAQ
jgi:Concanavalin A-like lectin/glucanases superfamily